MGHLQLGAVENLGAIWSTSCQPHMIETNTFDERPEDSEYVQIARDMNANHSSEEA